MRRKRPGVSLLELVVAVAIGAVLFTAAAQLLAATKKLFYRLQAHAIIQSGGQLGIGRFSEELRLASPLTLSILDPGLVAANVTGTPSTIHLAVAFRPQDDSGVSLTGSYSGASYYVIYYYDQLNQVWCRATWNDTSEYANPTPDAFLTNGRLSVADVSAILEALTAADAKAGRVRTMTTHVTAASCYVRQPEQSLLPFPSFGPLVVGTTSADGTTWPLTVGTTYNMPGVDLSLTCTWDYLAANTFGIQNMKGIFTEQFETMVTPRSNL